MFLLSLTAVGCRDENPREEVPTVSGTSNETSATSSQQEQPQSSNCDAPSKDDFFAAVEESDISVVSTYLNCGGNVNAVNNDYDRNTALHLIDDVDIARILMQASADINAEKSCRKKHHFNFKVMILLQNFW